jgi:hypothetical protein
VSAAQGSAIPRLNALPLGLVRLRVVVQDFPFYDPSGILMRLCDLHIDTLVHWLASVLFVCLFWCVYIRGQYILCPTYVYIVTCLPIFVLIFWSQWLAAEFLSQSRGVKISNATLYSTATFWYFVRVKL